TTVKPSKNTIVTLTASYAGGSQTATLTVKRRYSLTSYGQKTRTRLDRGSYDPPIAAPRLDFSCAMPHIYRQCARKRWRGTDAWIGRPCSCTSQGEQGDAGGNCKTPVEWPALFTCHSNPEKPPYACQTATR